MDQKRPIGSLLLDMKARSGLSLDRIAEKGGYNGRSSVQRYFSEEYEADALSPKVARNLARAFDGTNVTAREVLMLAEIDSIGGPTDKLEAVDSRSNEVVQIAEIDLRFGLGGQIMDEEVLSDQVRSHEFPLSWLRSITNAAPSELVWAKGQGDSMEPRISDGDIILIDRSQKSTHFGDLYWAIAYGQTAMIKRLRPMADGSIKILSDNSSVPDEVAWDGELNIFGRVIAVVKNV